MILQYTATKAITGLYTTTPGDRVGLVQTINTTQGSQFLTEMQPLQLNDDYVIAEVGDRSVVEVTIKSAGYYTGSFTLPYIEDAYLLNWLEFHESTRKREIFTIDASMIRGHFGTYDAYRTDNNTGLTHNNPCSGMQYTCQFQVINS